MMKKVIAFGLACLISACSAIGASASVSYTAASTGGNAVYIAGNPDMYPLEYFDSDSETYQGVLPEIYAKISESTGLPFTYIRSSRMNEQNRLSKNRQAEIISAHFAGEIEGLSDSVLLTSYEEDGKTIEVCIGFTDIVDNSVKASVKEAIENIPDSELLSLVLEASVQPKSTKLIPWFIVILTVLVIVIAVLVSLSIRRKIKDKKELQSGLIDPLTGIGNADDFQQNMKHMINPETYTLYYLAYISFDVEKIEKYLGTTEAEEVQRSAARILANAANELDFFGRISNGVFLYAFQSPTKELAGDRINELIEKLNDSDGKMTAEYRAHFRAGIFHMANANIPFETVILYARQGWSLAYQSKKPYAFADNTLIQKEATKEKLQRKISKAINNHEFKLYMQFIVDAKSGEIQGAEALSRWQNPEDGLLMPSQYIESMHLSGKIKELDYYMLEQICRQLEIWANHDQKDLWISCNFTRATMSESNFSERFHETVNQYTFDHDHLVIELTEDALADDMTIAYQNIMECKKSGFKIALDDLGSGYSSFSDLCDYPVDIIKIDRHIVAKSVTPRGNALLHGMTKLAHDLGIKVLCEGVETEDENRNSKNAACDYIQGYYYSRVLPQEETDAFLMKYKPKK